MEHSIIYHGTESMSEKIAPQFTCDTFGTLAPSMSRFFVSTHHARAIDHYFADFYAGVYDQLHLFTKEYFQGKWLNPNLFGCAKKASLVLKKSSAME